MAWLVLAASFLLARVLLLPLIPAPEPKIHDEFGYLLEAETFAHGHVAAPSPAHPQAFQSPHMLLTPVYASKYPPGQGLVLAAGQLLFHHPYAGVLLSTALFIFLICWAAAPWLPSHWTLAAGLVAWCFFFLRHYWAESYWGGSVAACGGALMFGVLGRVLRGWRFPWFAMGLGAVVLLITRPYEGGAFGAAVAVILLWRARDKVRLLKGVALPGVLILAAAIAVLGYYNAQITGNPLELPYATYTKQYSMTPPLWLMSGYGEKQYIDEQQAAVHRRELKDYQMIVGMSLPRRIVFQTTKFLIMNLWEQFLTLGLLLFALPFVRLHPRLGPVKLLVAAGFATLFLEVWMYPHYGAPFTAVQFVAIVAVARVLWYRLASAKPKYIGLVAIPAMTFVLLPFGVSWASSLVRKPDARAEFIHQLEQKGGRHLVFAEYLPGWSADDEWVYNGFDLNGRQVLLAHWHGEGEMRAVAQDYPGRNLWHLYLGPKQTDVRLEPVTVSNSGVSPEQSNKIASKN